MLSRVVTFFALSLGTCAPQLLQEMKPELPLPPLDLPRLFLFFVILIPRKAPLGLLKRLGHATTRSGPASLKTLPKCRHGSRVERPRRRLHHHRQDRAQSSADHLHRR